MQTARGKSPIREKEARRARASAGTARKKALADLGRQVSEAIRMGQDRESRELVNNPAHYGGDVPHEVVKCLEAWGLESDALLWNVVKYVARSGKKGPALYDLEKARWYLDRRINNLKTPSRAATPVQRENLQYTWQTARRLRS
jgi:hypothetical protein